MRDLAENPDRFERWTAQDVAEFIDRLYGAFSNRSTRLNSSDSEAWNRYSNGILGHHRVQFAAGQGGFHVGGLTKLAKNRASIDAWAEQKDVAKSHFLYVYDCGSHPRKHVEAEISDLRRTCGSRRLDILFLSHFDVDHMSGVPALIGKGKLKADTIVIPYVDDIEKVIAFARAATRGKRIQTFLKDVVVDTVGTLKSLGANRILLVDNGDGLSPEAPLVDPISSGPGDLPWTLESTGEALPEVRSLGRDSFYVRNGTFDISATINEGLQVAWRLVPYVQRADEDAKDLFAEIAETLLDWDDGSFRRRIHNPEERQKLVTDQAGLLGEVYRQAFGNKNATSLSLYSGPAKLFNVGATMISPQLKRSHFAKIGWLGTGDAPLRSAAKIDAFETHYSELLHSVSTFMLPHHGSIHNSSSKRLISDADIYVAAAEPGRGGWKHPDPHLRNAVAKAGKRFHHVSSARASRLDEAMIVFYCPPDAGQVLSPAFP